MDINENTRISLGWVVGILSGLVSCVLGAVIWMSSTYHVATQAAQDVQSLATEFGEIRKDLRIIRESQIRIEDDLSYYKKRKNGDDNNR